MNTPLEKTGFRRPVLPGFEHINHFYERKLNIKVAKLLPGQFYVTHSDEMIGTVLGSCISVCITDKQIGIGGMNHFMLPDNKSDNDAWKYNQVDKAARYGIDAMEQLVNNILKNGGRKKYFEIKITGGGRIMSQMADVGQKNIFFIKEYLRKEGYNITSEDVGGVLPRKVRFFPRTGRLQVKKLRALSNNTITKREGYYKERLSLDTVSGNIELFTEDDSL